MSRYTRAPGVLISELLRNDFKRLEVLEVVSKLALPQCYVAAGFIRNLVWDDLHNISTPLNDIDVVFFAPSDHDNCLEHQAQSFLEKELPKHNWQVKNQAFMHLKNGDAPYTSTLDAMSYWPEKETAIGVRLIQNQEIEVISAFGLENVFDGKITSNPKREFSVFSNRVKAKHWLENWTNLEVDV